MGKKEIIYCDKCEKVLSDSSQPIKFDIYRFAARIYLQISSDELSPQKPRLDFDADVCESCWYKAVALIEPLEEWWNGK
jgi:hypothetical protein